MDGETPPGLQDVTPKTAARECSFLPFEAPSTEIIGTGPSRRVNPLE